MLLLLFFRVVYSYQIRPACLHVGNNIDDDKAIASGFGLVSTNDKSDVLLKVFFYKLIIQIEKKNCK